MKRSIILGLLILVTISAYSQKKEVMEASVTAYIASYNEPDVKKKEALLEQSLHEDGKFYSSTLDLAWEEVLGMTSDFHEGYVMEILGNITIHHHYATFRWRYSEKGGGESWSGVDYCEFDKEGKIKSIVVFFDDELE